MLCSFIFLLHYNLEGKNCMFTFTTQYVYIFFKLKALFSKIIGLLLKAKYFYLYLN